MSKRSPKEREIVGESDNEPKLVRLELERSDGSILYLEGKDAEEWDDAVKSQSVFGWVHGMEFPQMNWKKKQAGDRSIRKQKEQS